MPKVNFVEFDGTKHSVDVEEGTSIMEAAVGNLIPGIDGVCGGAAACATCHVHIDAPWSSKLPPLGDDEESMLSLTDDRDSRSRLGCQIKMTAELDGIVAQMPEAQH